ncbi:hypothetical protein Cni_G17040 [Canna indica]|uniref:Uncharacterized protein n=1 Tax=Canna indica TaxID=4628 RepID=A0AAQ3KHQ7_9LILI|nr:hypothetical protein Cni_G17040 [Canna indica]
MMVDVSSKRVSPPQTQPAAATNSGQSGVAGDPPTTAGCSPSSPPSSRQCLIYGAQPLWSRGGDLHALRLRLAREAAVPRRAPLLVAANADYGAAWQSRVEHNRARRHNAWQRLPGPTLPSRQCRPLFCTLRQSQLSTATAIPGSNISRHKEDDVD